MAKTKTKAQESMMAQQQKNTSKGGISSEVGGTGNIEENDKSAQNPRLALMNSLRKKTPTPSSEGDASESASASTVSADPRAALLGAIRSKSKGAAGEEITFVEGAEPSSEGGKDDDSTQPSPILDPRAAMLAAIKKKKNNKGVPSSATEGGDAKQTTTADDPRSALLNAIKTKKNADGVAADNKDIASPELACIANRNLRSRSKGDSESQEDKNGGNTTKSTVEGDREARTNRVDHGDAMARGLVLTKSEANLVLENLGDDNNVERGADSAVGTGTKKQVELSDSVATQMAQTDTLLVRTCRMVACILYLFIFLSHRPSFCGSRLFFSCVFLHEYIHTYIHTYIIIQEEFDKSLARLDTKEADLSRSYNNDDSDCEDNCGSEVVAAGGALDDLASELARAEVDMLGQKSTTTEDIDTSAVAQAAAAKALAKRKQASSDGNPRAAMLAAISSRNKPDDEEGKEKAMSTPAPAPASVDPRSAMLAAISSRKKPDEKETEAPAPAPVDPRSAMLSAIRSRNEDSPGSETEEEKGAAQDPRAGLLASIQARRVD